MQRILVVAPFTHQNGHFVIFPRDISCALYQNKHEVTLVHTRPFRTDLNWFAANFKHICLRDQLENAPRWWQEFWSRFADYPSTLCLAWVIWKLRPRDYDLVVWTDFQAQSNVWAMTIARLLGFFRYKTIFFEHHPPDDVTGLARLFPRHWPADRLRLSGLRMFVFSKALLELWETRIGSGKSLRYVPWGVWPKAAPVERRALSRSALGIDLNARVLLVFGVQAVNRKHLDSLYDALSPPKYTGTPSNPLLILFVGAAVGHVPHPFSAWTGDHVQVRREEGFIAEDRVDDYFYAADAIWAHYRDFPGASGALLQAMGYGRISIASSEGEIGALADEYHLGILVGSGGTSPLQAALDEFVRMPQTTQAVWEQQIGALAAHFSWPRIAEEIVRKSGLHSPADSAGIASSS